MANRMNRKAWGLVAVLVVMLLVALAAGYAVWSSGAVTISAFLLEPKDWGFSRAIGNTNDFTMRDIEVESIKLGVIRVVKLTRKRTTRVGTPATLPNGTEQ